MTIGFDLIAIVEECVVVANDFCLQPQQRSIPFSAFVASLSDDGVEKVEFVLLQTLQTESKST